MWGGDLLQALVYEDLCLGRGWLDMHLERVFKIIIWNLFQ